MKATMRRRHAARVSLQHAASCAVALALVLLPSAAHAYRPFDSTDADVAEYGEFELELAPIGYLRGPTENSVPIVGNSLPLSFAVANFGFAPGWEFVAQGLGLVSFGKRNAASFVVDDTGVFVKHVFKEGTLQGVRGVSFAMELGFLLPEASTDVVGFSIDNIVSYRWKPVTAHFNFQISKTQDDHFDLFGGVIIEGPSTWRVRPVSELLVEDELGERAQESALVGLIWRVNEHLDINLAGRVARVTTADFGTTLGLEARGGLTIRFDTHLPKPK